MDVDDVRVPHRDERLTPAGPGQVLLQRQQPPLSHHNLDGRVAGAEALDELRDRIRSLGRAWLGLGDLRQDRRESPDRRRRPPAPRLGRPVRG